MCLNRLRALTAFGPSCLQANCDDASCGSNSTLGAEDCLRLAVYAPPPQDGGRGGGGGAGAPVVVWLHGGGFQTGDGAALHGAERINGSGLVAL